MPRKYRSLLGMLLIGITLIVFGNGGSAGCNGNGMNNAISPSVSQVFTITIQDFAYNPTDLVANAGDIIRVINLDNHTHTLTSESAPDVFDDTSVTVNGFDTGGIGPGAEVDFTVPADVQVGDVLYFYCSIHKEQMATPNGTITIGGLASSSGSGTGGGAQPFY